MWSWLEKIKSFISNVTDRILGRDAVAAVGEANTEIHVTEVRTLTDDLILDRIDVGAWERGMREVIKESYLHEYLLGRGGASQLMAADYGSIGGMVGEQYKYLSGFAQEIAEGKLTAGHIGTRAAMYARSAREAFERGKGRAWGVPDGKLPAYPGDGSTQCLTNCACSWFIEEVVEDKELMGWDCIWMLGPTEHCPGCLENADMWNPLYIPA